MALNGVFYADVPLRNYSFTSNFTGFQTAHEFFLLPVFSLQFVFFVFIFHHF